MWSSIRVPSRPSTPGFHEPSWGNDGHELKGAEVKSGWQAAIARVRRSQLGEMFGWSLSMNRPRSLSHWVDSDTEIWNVASKHVLSTPKGSIACPGGSLESQERKTASRCRHQDSQETSWELWIWKCSRFLGRVFKDRQCMIVYVVIILIWFDLFTSVIRKIFIVSDILLH